MTRTAFISLVAAATLAVLPAWAQDGYVLDDPAALAAWNAERAELFTNVCMDTAPSFAGFAAAAADSGFVLVDRNLVFAPEVVVNLAPGDGSCYCTMSMAAPDQAAMVMDVFQRVLEDYADSWRPTAKHGLANDTFFLREGKMVRMMLSPFEQTGGTWMTAMAIAPGECPQ